MRVTPIIALAEILTLASACADHALSDPGQLSATHASLDASPTWASVRTGEAGPGAQYALYMPNAWNGDVGYYAHGIRPASDPVDLPHPCRRWAQSGVRPTA